MAKAQKIPPTEEEFRQLIEVHSPKNPNIDVIQRTVIKPGPQSYKMASVLKIKNPTTGEINHSQLHLNTFQYRADGGIDFSKKERKAQWSCEDQEIERLQVFLNSYQDVSTPGSHTVVKGRPSQAFDKLLQAIGDEELDTSKLLGLIATLARRSKDLRNLPELGEEDNLRMVAAALRAAHRGNALRKLLELIRDDAKEQQFQQLLEANWWMLGGQYISMIPRRDWTVEDSLDILLQTADQYFEIIELKRSNTPLFIHDHGNWIVSAEVNRAVNQAAHYISEIEADRANLLRKYQIDLYKLKAKVLIGCVDEADGDAARKREALRMYNSHLHRIEVIPFGDLAKIADNVVNANIGESGQADTSLGEDVPF